MEYSDFVRDVVEVFHEKKNRKIIVPDHVFRGYAAQSASEIEDLLARYIFKIIGDQYKIFVDYSISCYKNWKYYKQVRPDILIVKKMKLMGIIEIKNDLGFLKESWANENNTMIENINLSRFISYNKNVGVGRSLAEFLYVSSDLKNCVAVISKENHSNKIESLKSKTSCFVLCGGPHPNHPTKSKDNVIEEISNSNDNDWTEFQNFLKITFS